MTTNKLIKALQRLKVKTGSIACLGCGHEHNCGIHGCAIIREAAEKLGDFNAVFNEDTVVRLADRGLEVEPGRLRELAEADRDGRVVVLPCKVGDTVYFRTYDCNGTVDLGIQPHKVTAIVWNAIVRGRYIDVGLPSGQYGVSWFLTREEAEKALEVTKNE